MWAAFAAERARLLGVLLDAVVEGLKRLPHTYLPRLPRMLNGMLAHDRLLDLVENFILFDESKAGAARKVVARNHQVLGVNRAVASVARQEAIKAEIPPGEGAHADAGHSAGKQGVS